MNIHWFFNLAGAYADQQDLFHGYEAYKKYLNIYAEHASYDATKNGSNGFSSDIHEIRDCTADDFKAYTNDSDVSEIVQYFTNGGFPQCIQNLQDLSFLND